MKNLILLRRMNMILLETGTQTEVTESSKRRIATVLKNLEALGYTVTQKVYDVLETFNEEELISFYREITDIIEKLTGGNVVYEPMYPNFPTEVMIKSDAELYLNAFFHYLTYGKLLPDINKDKRLPLFDETKVKVIDLANEDDLISIMQNIMESKTSISESDKADLAWFFENYRANAFMPDNIPMKENVAYVCKLYLNHTSKPDFKVIHKYVKTATDVLRLATAMSDGDISLAENTKFISFPRSIRRLFLSILNGANHLEEDMKRYKNKWIKLGERLHPAEYIRYNKATEAFKKIRNDEKIETFGGKLESHLYNGDYSAALMMLKTRAGEFARKLDYLLRTVDNKNLVINSFLQVINSVSTTVLLQVKNHFEHRNDDNPYRVFFPKGNLANAKLIENNLPEIPEKYCNTIVKICENALITEYQKRDFLGSVYLSEEFKNYYVPFNQRSASNSMRTVVRGSKLPIDVSTNTIRAFIHWRNMNIENDIWDGNRVDIDLSGVLYDENWNYNQGGIIATCMALTNMQKTTLYDLISLHIKARGLKVTDPADANVVFDIAAPEEKNEDTTYIDPFMLDVFMSEYL